ncbi:MAG: hypothetical protein P8O74_02995 [Paracoccaceae bacterium]|nr:hypothetical protein [Paracoccaceae bacterium]
MNFVKKTILIIFISFLYTGQVSSSKLPLDNLFWNIKDAKIIDELFIVASFEDGEETSFLIRSKASEEVFMITNKTGLIVEGSEYFFSKMNKKSILLKNASNKKIRISFADARDHSALAKRSTESKIQNDKPLVRTTMGYSPKDLDLQEAKSIALGLGVPKFLIENLNVLPVRGKSRTGRPGWALTDKFPAIFFTLTPFKENDLILAVDGISSHDIALLNDHLQTKGRGGKFAVEVQRSGDLKMIEVYMR